MSSTPTQYDAYVHPGGLLRTFETRFEARSYIEQHSARNPDTVAYAIVRRGADTRLPRAGDSIYHRDEDLECLMGFFPCPQHGTEWYSM